MSQDRFRPPSANVEDPRRGKGSAVKGVVLGFLADTAGTIVLGIVVTVVWGVAMAMAGHSQQEIGASLARSDADPVLSAALIGAGVLSSVLGGYVCERVARRGDYRVALVLCALTLAFGFALGAPSSSWPMVGLLSFLTIGSVLLGTRIAFSPPAATEP